MEVYVFFLQLAAAGLRLLGAKITLLDAEGNLVDKYRSMAVVRKKMRKNIKVMMTTGAGGTTVVYTRVFRLYGLYTQF